MTRRAYGPVIPRPAEPTALIDSGEAIKEIISMQTKTTTRNTDAWYAVNRVLHILWRLQDEARKR